MSWRVGIIGGGVSGLAAAHRVLELAPEAEITVYEGEPKPGGWLRTEYVDDFIVELGPDSILREKPAAYSLVERLGIQSHVITTRPDRHGAYVVSKGQLARVPEGFSLLGPGDIEAFEASPIMSDSGKERVRAERDLPPRAEPSGEPTDESLGSFVRRRFGWELLERLAQPLASGIYGADPEGLSLRATMPRFLDMEVQHGSVSNALAIAAQRKGDATSGARYGLFFAFDGGMQTLIDALQEKLGARLQTGQRVVRIEPIESRFRLHLQNGTTAEFDAVVLALPGPKAAPLLDAVEPDAARSLREVRHGSAATVSFIVKREQVAHPLDAYGFVVPHVEQRTVLASTWASEKWPGRCPSSHALIRVFSGGEDAHERSDEQLTQEALRELRELIGLEGAPLFTKVLRYPHAMPQYGPGHLQVRERVSALLAPLSNFALAGNSLHGVGIPDAIASGERAAEHVVSNRHTSVHSQSLAGR